VGGSLRRYFIRRSGIGEYLFRLGNPVCHAGDFRGHGASHDDHRQSFRTEPRPEAERTGMIMELPPYHKPKWGLLFKTMFLRSADIFIWAYRVVFVITIVFFCLTWTADGNVENSIIYKAGYFIDPVTRFFGLGWQLFMAFIAEAVSKPEDLAFIFAVSFTVPCVNAMVSTYLENHSLKWTLRIAGDYVATALLLSLVIFRVSSLFF
jgi:ferrous iron transport protein B